MTNIMSEVLKVFGNYGIIYTIYYEKGSDNDKVIFDFSLNKFFLPRVIILHDYIEFENTDVRLFHNQYNRDQFRQIISAFCQDADTFDKVLISLDMAY